MSPRFIVLPYIVNAVQPATRFVQPFLHAFMLVVLSTVPFHCQRCRLECAPISFCQFISLWRSTFFFFAPNRNWLQNFWSFLECNAIHCKCSMFHDHNKNIMNNFVRITSCNHIRNNEQIDGGANTILNPFMSTPVNYVRICFGQIQYKHICTRNHRLCFRLCFRYSFGFVESYLRICIHCKFINICSNMLRASVINIYDVRIIYKKKKPSIKAKFYQNNSRNYLLG